MKRSLSFVLFALFLAVAGCGTASVATTAAHPTMLQVERATHTSNDFTPFSRTATNAEKVQTLYNAALALPKETTGTEHSCPADHGLIYHLRFLQNGTLIQQMDLGASGCNYLLVGKDDMRAVSDTFITLFAQTMQVPRSQILVNPLPLKTKPVP